MLTRRLMVVFSRVFAAHLGACCGRPGKVVLMLAWALCSASASAGLVGVDRQMAPIRDWAFEQLTNNRSQFAEASQLYIDGKLDECHAALVKLRMANPGLPQPDLVIVWLQLSDHKLGQAKLRLEKLAAAVPRDPQVALTLGQIALAETRLADAAAHLERTALLPLPESWPAEQRQAFARTTLDTLVIAYERQSRWSDSKAILTTLISMGDKDFQFANRLARAHYNLGEMDQTTALLEKVAERSAGALPVPLLLADLAFSSGRVEEAEAAIQRAVELHPNNAEVQLWLAEWRLMRNEDEAAGLALASAKKLGQNSPRFWLSFGQYNMSQANYSEAVQAFKQAAQSLELLNEPHRTAVATNLLALSLVSQPGQEQTASAEALAIAEKNALAYSTDPLYVGSLGWIYFKQGRLEAAEPLLRRALELNPRVSADVSFFVADFYASSSDKREVAQTFLKAALESSQGIFVMRPLAMKLSKTLEVR